MKNQSGKFLFRFLALLLSLGLSLPSPALALRPLTPTQSGVEEGLSDALNPTRRSAAVFSTATGAEEKAKLTPLFSSPGRLYRTNQLLANEFGQSGILDVGIGWPSDPTRELSSLVPGRVRAVDIFVPTQVLTPNPETFPYHSVIYALFDWRGRLIVRSNTGAELVGTEIPPAMREGLVSLKDRLLAQVRDVGVKKFSDAD